MPGFTPPARWRPSPPVDPATVARRLAPAIQWPGPETEAPERCWRLVASTREFDAWVIAWPQATGLSFHDHGASSGAIAVVQGDLVETVPRREDSGRLTLVRRVLRPGSVLPLGQGHIHDVSNAGATTAVSLHVYSPPLTSMTHYDLVEGTRLVARRLQVAPEWDERPGDQASRSDTPRQLSRAG